MRYLVIPVSKQVMTEQEVFNQRTDKPEAFGCLFRFMSERKQFVSHLARAILAVVVP